jgi:hypothetical protein
VCAQKWTATCLLKLKRASSSTRASARCALLAAVCHVSHADADAEHMTHTLYCVLTYTSESRQGAGSISKRSFGLA